MSDLTPPQAAAPAPLPGITALVDVGVHESGIPVVLVKFRTGGADMTITIDASQAAAFISGVAQGVIEGAAHALGASVPTIAVPNGAGRLLIPAPGGMPAMPAPKNTRGTRR